METELYNSIRQAVSEGIGSARWLFIVSSLLFGGLGIFIGAYLKTRAENLAKNQNFKNVLAQLEKTVTLTEQIQSDSAQLKSYNQTIGQQLATKDNLQAILVQIKAQTKATEEIKGEFAEQTARAIEKIKAEIAKQTAMATQKQTRWSPLLGAARELKEKLDGLTTKYQYPPKDPWKRRPELPSEARDFCELCMLSEDPEPIDNWQDPQVDPGAPRKNEGAVQRVRSRMLHELTYAEDSLYRTAKYLGYAQRVRKELEHGQLIFPKEERKEMIDLLLKVREELHGTSETHPATGIIFERQESIGESVWDQEHDHVISDSEFREKLLMAPGWEEFTDLFRFFVDFHKKVGTEVEKTRKALEQLCSALERVCFSESSD